MKKILTILAVIAIFGLSSCKKESNDPAICNSDWDIETEAEYDAVVTAYNAYASDMSVVNCNAYKTSLLGYIEALEPFLECTSWSAADLQELEDLIDDADDAINQLNCQ